MTGMRSTMPSNGHIDPGQPVASVVSRSAGVPVDSLPPTEQGHPVQSQVVWNAVLKRHVPVYVGPQLPCQKPLPDVYTHPPPTEEQALPAKGCVGALVLMRAERAKSSAWAQVPAAIKQEFHSEAEAHSSEVELLLRFQRESTLRRAAKESTCNGASSSTVPQCSPAGSLCLPTKATVAQNEANASGAALTDIGVVPSLVGLSQCSSMPASESIGGNRALPSCETVAPVQGDVVQSLFNDPRPVIAWPDIPQVPAISFDVMKDADGWTQMFSSLSADLQRLLRCEKEAFIKALMMATAVCPAAWEDRNAFLRACLRNFQFATRKLLNDWAVLHTPICCFVLIMGCSGVNTGLMCVDWALRLYKQNVNHRLQTHLIEVWTYETDGVTETVGNLVTAELPSPFRVMRYQNVFNAPKDVMQFVDYPSSVRYICMGSTECNSISWANQRKYAPGKSGLHDHPSDSWFPWHECIWNLVQMKGPDRVIVLNELPTCKQTCDEKTLTAMSGVPVTVNASAWGHADRRRQIRTSPILGFSTLSPTMIPARNPRARLPDGATWHPTEAARGTTDRPVTLRRYFCKLLVERTRKTKVHSAFELLTMDSLRIIYPNNAVMNANVDFFLMHLGLDNTPVRRIKEILPCVKNMDGDGRAATDQTPPGQVQFCGANFHCAACTKAIQVLGGCWHLPSMTEVTYQVLARALDAWFGAGQATWYQWQHVPHHCDEKCIHRSATPVHG